MSEACVRYLKKYMNSNHVKSLKVISILVGLDKNNKVVHGHIEHDIGLKKSEVTRILKLLSKQIIKDDELEEMKKKKNGTKNIDKAKKIFQEIKEKVCQDVAVFTSSE